MKSKKSKSGVLRQNRLERGGFVPPDCEDDHVNAVANWSLLANPLARDRTKLSKGTSGSFLCISTDKLLDLRCSGLGPQSEQPISAFNSSLTYLDLSDNNWDTGTQKMVHVSVNWKTDSDGHIQYTTMEDLGTMKMKVLKGFK